jgi:hypothetical protein
MSETTEAPATGTPKLNAALAKFQAAVPKIAKGETASIPGREGRAGFGYSYAGLDAITDAALPLLGKHGLAFTAWPTLADGKFVLLYELLHESGEQKSGVFPLASAGRPQELGGLITYYRRYALCAVTGIAPGGEDDDAQTSNEPQQFDRPRSAAEAFENATPAPRRQQGASAVPALNDAALADWGAKLDEITSGDDYDRVTAEVREAMKTGSLGATQGNAILKSARIKRDSLARTHQPAGTAGNGHQPAEVSA